MINVACMGKLRDTYKASAGMHQGNVSLGRSRRRFEDYVKRDVLECEDVH
jgi:hypothetical protein